MAVIYDTRNGKIRKLFSTLKGARIAFAHIDPRDHLVVCDDETYGRTGAKTANELVEMTALFTGKLVKIRRADVGGPCDPSTERYHSM